MKNNDFFNYKKSVDDLSLVFSIAHFYQYSWKVIEKRIIDSKYFSLFNSDFLNAESYKTSVEILQEIFPDADTEELCNISYNELEWVATMYVNILRKTDLNFETIFAYLPIEEGIKMYSLYHEMDFSQSLDRFLELKSQTSLMKVKMKQLKMTNQELSKRCGLSQSMIDALKNRRRDIKKLDLANGVKISYALHISVETLLNN